MKAPACFYTKAFWIVIPLLIVSMGSGIAAIDAQVNGLDARIRNAEITIANNDVPHVKLQLDAIDQKVDKILINQAKMEILIGTKP